MYFSRPGYFGRHIGQLRAGRSRNFDSVTLSVKNASLLQNFPVTFETYSVSCLMGAGCFSDGIQELGRGVEHPSASSKKVEFSLPICFHSM
jgi:hypothetical protein